MGWLNSTLRNKFSLVEKSEVNDADVKKDSDELGKFDAVLKEFDDTHSNTSSEKSEYEFTSADIDEVVNLDDDVDVPASTIRMWVLALVLSSVLGGVDAFFTLRFPAILIGAIVAQLLAFPLGNFWYMVMPNWQIGFGKYKVPLNPGPFNQKEHTLVYIFTNTVTSTRLVNISTTEQIKFFNIDYGIGKAVLFNISSFILSWGWCGFALPILVYPAEMVWPGILSSCALMKTLHSRENPYVPHWKISRMAYFAIIFVFGFVWYFFSDFILPFITNIGAFITWIVPDNATVGQVFGTLNGLSLLPITFDWSTILSLSNPLTVPYVHAATVFISFVFWVWCVIPGLYYQNKWQVAHFPILTNAIYNINGTSYNASKVVDSKYRLSLTKYEKYSPVLLPVGFLITTALTLAAFASLVVTVAFNFKKDVIGAFRHARTDIHNELMLKYRKVHWLFYAAAVVLGLVLGIIFVQVWKDQSQINVGGYFVSVIIGACLFVPLCMVEAQSTLTINLQALFNLVGAFWFKGRPLAVMYFMNFGFATLQHAEHMSQGAKMSHYLKVPPITTMVVLFLGGIWASLLNCGVTIWLLNHVSDVCSTTAKNHMTCRTQRTTFNQHLVWGLFGNHVFAKGGRYSFILYFFLVGFVVALVINLLKKYRPDWPFVKYLNPTLLVSGAGQIPTNTGINYASWFSVAFVFNYLIHKYKNAWWKKYNLVTAVGLDCGTAIAGIIVFFCLTYTGASDHYSWWGTNVVNTGCDANACPHLSPKSIRHPGKW